MGDYVPRFDPGDDLSYTVTADTTGGQVVEITGDRTVAPTTGASGKVAGVAAFDAANGAGTTVYAAGVHELVAAEPIVAGEHVQSAGLGKVATYTGGDSTHDIGLALTSAAAADDTVLVQRP